MRLESRRLRFAWAAHTVVTPEARKRAVGFLRMRKLLAGPQDATLGDSASPLMEQMWLRLGGRRLELKGVHWIRVFRPCSVAAHLTAPRRPRLRSGLRALAATLDELSAPGSAGAHRPPGVQGCRRSADAAGDARRAAASDAPVRPAS